MQSVSLNYRVGEDGILHLVISLSVQSSRKKSILHNIT